MLNISQIKDSKMTVLLGLGFMLLSLIISCIVIPIEISEQELSERVWINYPDISGKYDLGFNHSNSWPRSWDRPLVLY